MLDFLCHRPQLAAVQRRPQVIKRSVHGCRLILIRRGGRSAGGIAQIISDLAITQMSVVGSLVIAGIALNLMNITKIKIGNFILCPFIPAFLSLGEKLLTLI